MQGDDADVIQTNPLGHQVDQSMPVGSKGVKQNQFNTENERRNRFIAPLLESKS